MDGWDLLISKVFDDSVNVDKVIKELRKLEEEEKLTGKEAYKMREKRRKRIKYMLDKSKLAKSPQI